MDLPGFLNKLKSLVNFEAPKKIENVHLFSANSGNVTEYHDQYHDHSKVLNINIGVLDVKAIPELQKILNSFVHESDGLILEDKTEKILNDVNSLGDNPEDSKLIEFYKTIITSQDLEILRASLLMKRLYDNGQNIGYLKEGLIFRYGDRGNNISNLCTAGYFKTMIKPLYEQMITQSDFSLDKFRERYETIVTQYPFAVFVGREMTYINLKKEVFQKLERGIKYGLSFINIHGISERNVGLINQLLAENKKRLGTALEIDSGRNYIKVKIILGK